LAGSYYSSEADINLDDQRAIELTESAAALGQLNQSVLDQTSLDAQDEIDDRLGGTYAVPFPAGNVPPAIRRLHKKVWKRLLFERRDTLAVPPTVEADYQKALADLEDYATPGDGGRILVGAARVSAATGSSSAGSFSSDPDSIAPVARVFGRYKDRLG
jgi:phage gp36-like protein